MSCTIKKKEKKGLKSFKYLTIRYGGNYKKMVFIHHFRLKQADYKKVYIFYSIYFNIGSIEIQHKK